MIRVLPFQTHKAKKLKRHCNDHNKSVLVVARLGGKGLCSSLRSSNNGIICGWIGGEIGGSSMYLYVCRCACHT